MSAEDEVIDATWHPDAQYMRFREGNAVRGQLQPADSILYRTITDVPKVPESDDILDWCMASWEKPFLSVSAAGWETHDAAADTPENAALGQPGFYLDEAPLVPAKRNMELSNPSAPYKSTGPVQQDLLFKWTNDYFPARTERRVKAGHARSQYSVLFPGNVKPFHPVDNDRATLTIWPSLRITTETVSTDWAGITKDSRVGSYTQRSWDSNAWPRYWDPTKPGNLGSYAGRPAPACPCRCSCTATTSCCGGGSTTSA